MAGAVSYPKCVSLEIPTTSEEWQVDPEWTGGAFAIAFFITVLVSAAVAPYSLRSWRNRKMQERDRQLYSERGTPMHAHYAASTWNQRPNYNTEGKEFSSSRPSTFKKPSQPSSSNNNNNTTEKGKGISDHEQQTIPSRHTDKTSNEKDISEPLPMSMAEVLLKNDEEEAILAITSQDLADVSKVERSIIEDKIKATMFVLKLLIQRMVAAEKVDEESAKAFIKESENQLQEALQVIDEQDRQESSRAEEKVQVSEESQQPLKSLVETNTPQNCLQRLSDIFLSKEDQIEKWLRAAVLKASSDAERPSEAEVDQLVIWFKNEMLNLEKKLADETHRQLKVLDYKKERRRELCEVAALRKNAHSEEYSKKLEEKKNILERLVQDGQMTQEQAMHIMNAYRADLEKLHEQQTQEFARQEQQLTHKLQQRRGHKLMRLEEQQQREKLALSKQMRVSLDSESTNTELEDASKVVTAYVGLMQKHREEKEEIVAKLDQEEASEVTKVIVEAAKQNSEICDSTFQNVVSGSGELPEGEASRLIALHRQQMDAIKRTAERNAKRANDKLQEKLAQQRRKREEEENKIAIEQIVVAQLQEAVVKKVMTTQVEISEDEYNQILAEHKKNVSALSTQLSLNQRRQQAELEKKLASRRAQIPKMRGWFTTSWMPSANAMQQNRLMNTLGFVNDREKAKGEAQRRQIAAQIDAQEKRIQKEHASALDELKRRMAEKTKQSLEIQEERLSMSIGKLQVGQARRKSVLQRQSKLLAELQGQMADKLANKKTTPSAADQLIMQHQNEVSKLSEQLETDKERQERMLQDKLERKKLLREQDIMQQIRTEAEKELEEQRARGAGKSATALLEIYLEQKHKKAMEDLDVEIQAEMRKQRDEMNKQYETELRKALDEKGKTFMATVTAISDLSTQDINEAVHNAAGTVKAKDAVIKRLAKEFKAEVKRAKSSYGERRNSVDYSEDNPGLRRTRTDINGGSKNGTAKPRSAKPKPAREAF